MQSDETLISKLGDDHLSAPPVGYCLRSRRLSCFKALSPATEFRSFPALDLFRRFPSAPRTKRRRGIKLKGSPISKLEDDDLLLEILIRLPDPITAWRCKPVCKRWNSLVSTSYFKRRFVSHHQSKVRNAVEVPLDLSSLLSSISLPDEIRPFCRILDCFQDLVLCGWLWEEKYINDELARLYLVCNWFTKQWIALPLAPEMRGVRVGMVARLVCEPFSKNSDDNNLDTGDGQVFGLSSVVLLLCREVLILRSQKELCI
ncbi:unnamed protein product [Linum tenue]|uniref:F-box domain-containing protein n=1 Tax=Linum tenue TaxID=586396 RepID=A0AAV0IER0_9ROSI|nr:unnamed protein product [Linum tenue]